jgi:uncharacterized membrane protein YoaK (UPF0700 family)
MTTFEAIILIIIYMICYGYILAMCIEEEENRWFRLLLAIVSLVFVIYAPLMIGGMLYKKLEKV